MILTPRVGMRVAHDMPVPSYRDACGDRHRKGKVVSKPFDSSRGKRVDVQWDCGCLAKPLLRLLRRDGRMPLAWLREYRQKTHQLTGREIAEQFYAFGLTPDHAARWALRGFLPAEARPWIMHDFTPTTAARNANQFRSVEQVLAERARRQLDEVLPG
ncbi:hypothetical protein [Micromonospora sp. WMMC273]|uniref:hypothetical protein n=1 Tax=Micromonospora sp. WMMC273 TaxID=3015157 RepID=UPI0022B6C008|nr:hypothetical protein [Micromonospora sp. WMMC273]MCZ7478863.1 hypothetical protein [Micromonospora sp. WMMC273]MCZ7478972.1 hypothetical protein [Micromonospora sp. WMMC273]